MYHICIYTALLHLFTPSLNKKNGPVGLDSTPAGHCQSKVDPAWPESYVSSVSDHVWVGPSREAEKKTQELLFQHMFQMKTHLNGCNCDIFCFFVVFCGKSIPGVFLLRCWFLGFRTGGASGKLHCNILASVFKGILVI